MPSYFKFKQFRVRNEDSALKVGTDAVLLGCSITINPNAQRALDIGSGTGVIALIVAQRTAFTEQSANHCSESGKNGVLVNETEDRILTNTKESSIETKTSVNIDAVEIDPASAEEATYNFNNSPWSERLQLRPCSLQHFAKIAGEYDLIFSNPPFYDNSLLNPDSREAAARHENSLTLSDICRFASEHLSKQGQLSLILPCERINSFKRLAASFSLFPFRVLNIKTSANKTAKRSIIELSKQRSTIEEQTLVLMQNGERSPEYRQLTRDFYL